MAHAPLWDALPLIPRSVHFGRGTGQPWEGEPLRESGVATTTGSATLPLMA